jgi:hypothetical protein
LAGDETEGGGHGRGGDGLGGDIACADVLDESELDESGDFFVIEGNVGHSRLLRGVRCRTSLTWGGREGKGQLAE